MSTTAYLTIDDAPSPRFAEVVDLLDDLDVPAVFFCEGQSLERRPDPVVDAIRRGFPVGNHAYSHPNFSAIGRSRARAEVRRTDRLIDALHDRAGVERATKAFRFPYGDHGVDRSRAHVDWLQDLLRAEGYDAPALPGIEYDWYDEDVRPRADWFWTVDLREYREDWDRDDVLAAIRGSERLAGDSADIVLTHDHVETTDDLGAYVRALREAGVVFERPPV